ncbi:hypothetical protein [Chitinophaga barathri]|uniref:Uncharacterized protein n=1 Tax=Chitinophaga barathri TaxID=1647451 RepID=A0A3N4MF13_9BACT|nr:hypothetical protein [Chitinophaga barathri]RPD38680.1 hypothetical protein EG028_23500 [Chitinophaga barathri]
MKPYSIVILVCVLFAACAGPSSEKKAEESEETDELSAAISTISNYATSIDVKASSGNKIMAAHNFNQGDNTSGVVGVFSDKNTPIRLYIFPEGNQPDTSSETWFYLDTVTVAVKLMREIITTKSGVIENSFYFDADTLLQSESRKAPDLASLDSAEIVPYTSPYGHTDFRFDPQEVNDLAQRASIALTITRRDLSPGANDARKMGASHWATGNEPGWSLAIIPYKKILYTGNYGEQKIEFPPAQAQKGDNDASIFSTSADGHTLDITFENKVCTDDAGKKSPGTVTLKLDGKVLRGCGQSLF